MSARIESLPRRDWRAHAPVDHLTALLRRPGGTQELFPFQACGLAELAWIGGLVGFGSVGVGKTLIAGLAPTVTGARRPLLLVPANGNGVRKARKELAEYALHWRIDLDRLTIRTYQWLGRRENADALERGQFDLVICDESQWLKNAHRDRGQVAAVALRVCEYGDRFEHVRFVFLSGSPGDAPDFMHLIALALRHNAPVPDTATERKCWQQALNGEGPPGILLGARDSEDAARRFGERIRTAPGVIITTHLFDGPLYLRGHIVNPTARLEPHWVRLRDTAEAPDGYLLGDRMQTFGFARRLAREYYTRHDPRPPKAYLDARRAWGGIVRGMIEHGLADSEGHAVSVLPAQFRPFLDAWLAWRNAWPMTLVYEPLDHAVVRACAEWARQSPGVVWVHGAEFGRQVASVAGVPYYGLNSKGAIMGEDGRRSVVASIAACGTAFNLQAWHRALVTHLPSGPGTAEQLVGRHHRTGQREPVVVDWLCQCIEDRMAYDSLRSNAYRIETLTGQPQKVIHTTTEPEWYGAAGDSAAWRTTANRAENEDDYE